MRHRMGIAALTHIGGNNSPVLLDNQGELNKTARAAINHARQLYFHWTMGGEKMLEGVDFHISDEEIKFGKEPAYQFEDLRVISINKDKSLSYMQTGKAFDAWGSGIRSRTKYYKDYKYNSKFKKFVDKWHDKLFV